MMREFSHRRGENVNSKQDSDQAKLRQKAWIRLRGAGKDVYAEYGGGEAYLRKERKDFNESMERRENLIAESDLFRTK
jgi:hypothetical protein